MANFESKWGLGEILEMKDNDTFGGGGHGGRVPY